MKRIICTLSVLFLLTSCVKHEIVEVVSLEEARAIADNVIESDGYEYNKFNGADIYFLDQKGYLHKEPFNSILQWYQIGHRNHLSRYKSLTDYVYMVLNQRLGANDSIVIRSMDICCKVDSGILCLYHKRGFKSIVEQYSKYDTKRECYRFHNVSSEQQEETIAYLFFINRYLKHESDVVVDVGLYPFPNILHKSEK